MTAEGLVAAERDILRRRKEWPDCLCTVDAVFLGTPCYACALRQVAAKHRALLPAINAKETVAVNRAKTVSTRRCRSCAISPDRQLALQMALRPRVGYCAQCISRAKKALHREAERIASGK